MGNGFGKNIERAFWTAVIVVAVVSFTIGAIVSWFIG